MQITFVLYANARLLNRASAVYTIRQEGAGAALELRDVSADYVVLADPDDNLFCVVQKSDADE